MKFLKRFLVFLLVIVVALVVVLFSFLNTIEYQVTDADLPSDVYETSGDLLAFAKLKAVSLVLAGNEDRYTIMEEFINLIILDSIRENINPDYDPLATDCSDTSCDYIMYDEYYFIEYAYAELNDDNQLVITISAGANKYVSTETALIMVFDIEFDIVPNMQVVLTLDTYYLGEKQLSQNLLDQIFDRVGRQSIEDSITFGDLNLTDYTYTISIQDAMS